jgi:hypothetical protein
MSFHFFDPYREDKAARERGEWRKSYAMKGGPHQNIPLWRGGLAGRKKRPVTLAKVK